MNTPRRNTPEYPKTPLLKWRLDQRLDQTQAAARLDIHVSQYCRYERGMTLPKADRLAHFERATGGAVTRVAMVLAFYKITRDQVVSALGLHLAQAPQQKELQLA